jgi:hypothetical protein
MAGKPGEGTLGRAAADAGTEGLVQA